MSHDYFNIWVCLLWEKRLKLNVVGLNSKHTLDDSVVVVGYWNGIENDFFRRIASIIIEPKFKPVYTLLGNINIY